MKPGTLILALCIVCGSAFLAGLGVWQMQRLTQKEAMIARAEENRRGSPVSATDIEQLQERGEDIEYRPMAASGEFLHAFESHYFTTHKGASGYFIYTPLRQQNGVLLMVNRGFVPYRLKEPEQREQGLVSGQVALTGLARTAPREKPNRFFDDNDLAKNVFYWKSLPQMLSRVKGQDVAGAERFFMDVNDAPVPGGWPVGGVTLISFPNNHLQYALTWFGLSGALLVVGGLFLRRRLTENRVGS